MDLSSLLLGNAEFLRFKKITSSIGTADLDQTYGDVFVWMLRRGQEVRFVNRGGLHRMAAMDALGSRDIPARFQQLGVFNLEEVNTASTIWVYNSLDPPRLDTNPRCTTLFAV